MLTQKIRRQFLQYFKNQSHAVIASSPVIPHEDPTLLFINAGMNQFKDVFLGKSERDYKRATTAQKCIRAGGKHNDLENVGHTTRHLTFFEMLGNFSFGDYFKEEAIQFAWEISTKVFELDPERIWPTVFRDDDEAFEMWKKYVPAERITRFGEKENFWAMGDTGPCGPCSELLYDRGSHYGKAANPSEDASGERFLEYWNLVFMQYNRLPEGKMEKLPKPSIDTGVGLERVVSLKMEVETVFDTDVLRAIIAQVEKISGRVYTKEDLTYGPAFRVIADHLRCLAFAIADGVQPSNVDRGYVLRKILRRAVRYGRMLGFDEPFLGKILPKLIELMGEDYPELEKSRERICEILTLEEEAFMRTLRRGGNLLSQIMESAQKNDHKISGDEAFKLKDTYGFPLEEIVLIAKDADLTIDTERYHILENEAKERSRGAQKNILQVASENIFADLFKEHGGTTFIGYTPEVHSAQVKALLVDGKFVAQLEEGEEGVVILDRTSFYAEMGGQVGDEGVLSSPHDFFKVNDCTAPFKGIIAHIGQLEKGLLKVGDTLQVEIDPERRQKIANNHTATHLLHWALHKVLGEHVKQAGSVVDPERLRFDFSHHKALNLEEIREIENLVNAKIRQNLPVHCYELSYEEAQLKQDIKQFFGEKYSSIVRVIDIDFSKELCGGTHTSATGNIGYFRISKESSIAAGVRRIEAVSGAEAEKFSFESEEKLLSLAGLLKTLPPKLQERTEKLLEENKTLHTELKAVKRAQMESLVSSLLSKVEEVNHIPLLTSQLELSAEELKLCSDEIMEHLKSGVAVLASAAEGRCSIIVRVFDDLVAKGIKAGDLVKAIAPLIEGSGGGKPQSAQAGGKAPHKIEEALAQIRSLLFN